MHSDPAQTARDAQSYSIKPLSSVLGYGTELADALERYASAPSDKESPDGPRKQLREAWKTWMSSCPHAQHLCFADITIFTTDQVTVQDALTIVITPEGKDRTEKSFADYQRVLQEVYLPTHHTMAPHKVFADGLPCIWRGCNVDGPQTAEELEDFYRRLRNEPVENGIFLAELGEQLKAQTSVIATEASVSQLMLSCEELMKTYGGKISFTEALSREVSSQPISKQWKKWMEVFEAELHASRSRGPQAEILRSSVGGSLHWLVAAPVGFRNPKDPADYTLVACVFLGFDELISKDELHSALRYVLVNLYEANATAFAVREGQVTGREAAAMPAIHEIKYVISAIHPQAPAEVLDLLRAYFQDVFQIRPTSRGREVASPTVTLLLDTLIQSELEQAARLERLVSVAQDGLIGNVPPDRVASMLNSFAERVTEGTAISGELRGWFRNCCKSYHDAFQLALLGALRNSIRHTFVQKRPRNPQLSIRVAQCTRTWLLMIESTCERIEPQERAEADEREGTLAALRNYARSYRMDPRLVSLKRTQLDPVNSQGRHRETWTTIIPLPECE